MASFKGYVATREQVDELTTILSIMRPHQSKMEAKFIDHFIKPLKPTVDAMGNLIVKVGDAPVLWSCHVDTVHHYGGIAPIEVTPQGIIQVPSWSKANCLGADDGAGVWLMLQMIRAERPGLYVFHRGEERGGIGSRYIASNTPGLLKGIECAIAFDRKDTGSIITHQWGGRCCSEDFSKSLSKAIGLGMKSDSTGSFTDTASYTGLIGECTNVSVGYKGQHGKGEEQDLVFLLDLHQAMLEVDTRDFVYKRKPGEKEPRGKNSWGWGSDYSGGYHSDHTSYYKDPKLGYEQGKVWDAKERGYVYEGKVWDEGKKKWVDPSPPEKNARKYLDTREDTTVCRRVKGEKGEVLIAETMLALVCDFPEEIAAILEEKQYGLSYLHEQIRKHGGVVETGYITKDKNPKVCPNCHRLNRYCIC